MSEIRTMYIYMYENIQMYKKIYKKLFSHIRDSFYELHTLIIMVYCFIFYLLLYCLKITTFAKHLLKLDKNRKLKKLF